LSELSAAYSAAGASLYQQAGATQDASQGAPEGAEAGAGAEAGGQKKEDVVEADYEIVDEEKK
jgi:molecular chaperone DnaK